MKPTFQQKHSGENVCSDAPHFPFTDCNYHSVAMPPYGGCARRETLSFRNISGEYFRKEAQGEFRNELMAFAAIIITAAFPILSNMHALADFLRAIGSL